LDKRNQEKIQKLKEEEEKKKAIFAKNEKHQRQQKIDKKH
jgi:hypothetical protein